MNWAQRNYWQRLQLVATVIWLGGVIVSAGVIANVWATQWYGQTLYGRVIETHAQGTPSFGAGGGLYSVDTVAANGADYTVLSYNLGPDPIGTMVTVKYNTESHLALRQGDYIADHITRAPLAYIYLGLSLAFLLLWGWGRLTHKEGAGRSAANHIADWLTVNPHNKQNDDTDQPR